MSYTDSDEDISRAIALSLQESPPMKSARSAILIDLTSLDEDDDLGAPLAAAQPVESFSHSAGAGGNIVNDTQTGKINTTNDARQTNQKPPGETILTSGFPPSVTSEKLPIPQPSTFLGLDRKQMEKDRLARANRIILGAQGRIPSRNEIKKRKASTSPPLPDGQTRRNVKNQSLVSSPVTEKFTKFQSLPLRDFNQGKSPSTHAESKTERLGNQESTSRLFPSEIQRLAPGVCGVQFPDGVVKKTWIYGIARVDDIKIEEVLQKNDLELAVLSAYQVDTDWVMSKLDLAKTKVIWVLQAKDESEKQNWQSSAPKTFRFCFPPMDGNINCMHSKLQLLAHPTHLRIVVPSANLVPYDWGESGTMENVLFLIDLPRLPGGHVTNLNQLTEFGRELLYFMTAMGLDKGTIDSMRRFDFSRTNQLAFVHSIGGSHSGTDWQRTGYCGLGTAIRKLNLNTDGLLTVDCLSASIGSLDYDFIKRIYLAAKGDDGLTEYRWRTSKPTRGKSATETAMEHKLSNEIKNDFRIYFPTKDTVSQSKGGVAGGATICFKSRWYDSDTFPRALMRDSKSRRTGTLMHNKMLLARLHKPSVSGSGVDSQPCIAWAYIGSANLSESAWGRLVKDRTTKEPKLNCRNWECGVIVPVPFDAVPGAQGGQTMQGGVGIESSPAIEVFNGHVPVPMVVPGEEYGLRRPWFYSEQ